MAKRRYPGWRPPRALRRKQLPYWWPLIVQLFAMSAAAVGLYVGITRDQAVQSALFNERTNHMQVQMDSLQRNIEGLQRYIIELHRQERQER